MAKASKKANNNKGAKNITVKTNFTADELFKLAISTPLKAKNTKKK